MTNVLATRIGQPLEFVGGVDGMSEATEATEVTEVTIKVNDNGSYRIEGPVKLVDAEGNEFEHKEKFSLCRCGHSHNKPFCDGSHRDAGFQDASRVK